MVEENEKSLKPEGALGTLSRHHQQLYAMARLCS